VLGYKKGVPEYVIMSSARAGVSVCVWGKGTTSGTVESA